MNRIKTKSPLVLALSALCILLAGTCGKKNNIHVVDALPEGIIVDSICYSRNIEPLITAHCAACHPSINGIDLSGYANAKSHIDRMIIRTTAGTMPAAGPKLTPEQIDTLKAWRTNGEKQCN
jgi:hypothetical protein